MPQIHRPGQFITLAKNPVNGIILDEDLAAKYNEKIVEKARQLKADNQDKYSNLSDEYYLQYAQKLILTQYIKERTHFNNIQNIDYQITDPKWAGFSYEEIIEMENNGCVIPQEVLQWAHAQQEADVTNYIIISDNTASDDETSKEDNDINSLKKKVQQYVTQSENAIETSEKLFEEFNLKTEKANQIKKEKEDTYKDQMSEISKLTKEWKELDEKNKSDSLNESEKKRYTELGKQLNGSNGTKMKEVKNTQTELDDFLDSIDGINNQVIQNTQISNDTTNAAKELSKLTRHFANFIMPHDKKESVVDNGLLSNSLQNVKGDEIAITALKTVENLDETTNTINDTISDGANVELAEFSNNYSDLASKTEENTKNTMGDDYDKASEDDDKDQKENNAKEQMKTKDKYHVAKVFSFANSIVATETTNKSAAELRAEKRKAQTDEKELKKAVKESEKDINELNKEASKIEKRKEEKVQEEEQFLAQLDALNNNKKEIKPTEQQQVQEEKQTTEKDSIVSEMEEIDSGDNELTKGLEKTLAKSTTSSQKTSKLAKLLRGETQEVVKLNNNTQKVANDTIFVGAGTTAQSIITGTIGYGLVEVGSFLMGSIFPPTVAAGTKMVIAGVIFLNIAQLELATGTTAIATGADALDLSKEAKDTTNDTKASEKDANQTVKENNAQMKESTQNPESEDSQAPEDSTPATTENNTEETQTSQNTEENTEKKTEEKAEQETNTENPENTQPQKEKDAGYSVDTGYDFAHAFAAAATTTKASIEVNTSKETALNKQNQFKTHLKAIKQIEKQNEKTQKLLELMHTKTAQKATQTIQKIELANMEIEQASKDGNAEQAFAAQIESENLSAEMNNSLTQESSASTSLTKNINKTTNSLKTLDNSSQDLKKELQDFNKKIDTQLDVSQKTLVIGAGTYGVGVATRAVGLATYIAGMNLLSNPLTSAIGIAMMVTGELEWQVGALDIVAAGTALVTGAGGLVAHATAKDSKTDASETLTTGNSQIKSSRQKVKESQQQNIVQEKEAQTLTNEVTSISASASSNMNTNDNTKTDDKEDRKLTRFNEDSMIESKKKKKKVMAVSASSKG